MQFKILYVLLSFIPLLILYQCTNQQEKTTLSSDGVEISFNVQGKGKPAIVFVHGWTNNKTLWENQVKHFSEKYKVVTIDLAGHGNSGNNRNNWTISAFGDDVARVINKLKLKEVVFVGFSLGGQAIVETANKIPGRVKGLIFVDSMQNIEMKFPPEMIDNYVNYLMDVVTNPTEEKFVGSFIKRNTQESFKRLLSQLEGASQKGWEEMIREFYRWYNEDCLESIKLIKSPIIAINSESPPTNVEAFNAYVPSFNVKIINDVGHVVFWDAPDEFNQLLEESIQELY